MILVTSADATATQYLLLPVNPDWIYLPGFTFLVPAHPGSTGQNPESRKTVVVVIVVVLLKEKISKSFVCLRKTARDYFDATASNWNTSTQSRPPGESLCIKTGSQIGGWVSSSLDHVIRGGPKYTISLPAGRAMSVD